MPTSPARPAISNGRSSSSRRGSLIVVDNVVREGAILEADGDDDVQGMRRFFELAASDPRVSGTATPDRGRQGP